MVLLMETLRLPKDGTSYLSTDSSNLADSGASASKQDLLFGCALDSVQI